MDTTRNKDNSMVIAFTTAAILFLLVCVCGVAASDGYLDLGGAFDGWVGASFPSIIAAAALVAAFAVLFIGVATADKNTDVGVFFAAFIALCLVALLSVAMNIDEKRDSVEQAAVQALDNYDLELVEIERNTREYDSYIYLEATDGSSYYELYLRENEDGSYSLYQYKDGVYSLYGSE